jgi:hypothetical protein
MSFASEPETLVLHGLRLKGFAEADAVAGLVGLDEREVIKQLDVAEAEGLVKHRDGRVSGWTLTAAGRAEDERRLADELAIAGARPAIEAGYRRFLENNAAMLQVCTDWQMREVEGKQVVNDHSDRSYDEQVIGRLADIDSAAQPVCTELSSILDRFASYGPRLRTALSRLQAGDLDWFTKPTIDSYHTVWFELHENLLATLGIERGTE